MTAQWSDTTRKKEILVRPYNQVDVYAWLEGSTRAMRKQVQCRVAPVKPALIQQGKPR